MLTSTGTYPLDAREELHTSAVSDTYAAVTIDVPNRHSRPPSASADDEKPLPTTVTGVPPSDTPREGHTDDTAADARYVNDTLLDEYC